MDLENLLHKWLNGTATPEEVTQLKASPEYASYLEISAATAHLKTPEVASDQNYKAIASQLQPKNNVRKLFPVRNLLKIAAVLAIFVVGYLYVDSLDTTIHSQIAKKETFTLPDSSEVALNANSTITYNKNNWNSQRTLNLQGEAYFKVTKGNTFSVKTPLGTVTVLGTQFNVFSRDKQFNITCYEGLVSVAYNDTLIKLPAGSQLSIENNTLIKHANAFAPFPSWTANESSFENADLAAVLEELERQYPIQLTATFSNANRRFTGSFTHTDLTLALKSICDPLQLAFTIEDERVTIYANKSQ
ncbi:FecR family protein [Ulvibacter litoralis]|uniref:Ferric-dicitrate binding protein FerR, regulates iron transport through sigma-19 n=1 Tax=Ulvibacter litoralis TaxID=227084 RepID=A0A1G7BUT9_9FLAO|nr:FecR domain-containing protein [Ulvibacter litoralis]GHC49662.1 iron dicitrate transporter FecR [Ulvibacter litoralis]SDE30891.1 ferric-dicitrate binding protein FerR, regulates iron transport through sigma-19 [Ulvibacter litoralis]